MPKELEFKDLPDEMQEAASYIIGENPKDPGRVLALADILFALHTFKECVMLGPCHCGELGPEIRKGAAILCPKHDKEWPFCQVPGCRNKTGGKGFCSPHQKLATLTEAAQTMVSMNQSSMCDGTFEDGVQTLKEALE